MGSSSVLHGRGVHRGCVLHGSRAHHGCVLHGRRVHHGRVLYRCRVHHGRVLYRCRVHHGCVLYGRRVHHGCVLHGRRVHDGCMVDNRCVRNGCVLHVRLCSDRVRCLRIRHDVRLHAAPFTGGKWCEAGRAVCGTQRARNRGHRRTTVIDGGKEISIGCRRRDVRALDCG